MKVLVTGSNGQLGKTLKENFNSSKDLEFIFASKETLDITNEIKVNTFFKEHNFQYCINCAAYTNVEKAEKAPSQAFLVNAEAVKNLAETCNNLNVILIHISTDYVFDGIKNEPYTVTDLPNPINEYGKSKLKGEFYINQTMSKYFIVRTSWLYSKIFGNNFYKSILTKAKSGKIIGVVNNQTSCPTDCVDLSDFIIDLITKRSKNYGILHFCGPKEMTWFDFAIEILKENNLLKSTQIKIDNYYVAFAKRPIYSVLKCTGIISK